MVELKGFWDIMGSNFQKDDLPSLYEFDLIGAERIERGDQNQIGIELESLIEIFDDDQLRVGGVRPLIRLAPPPSLAFLAPPTLLRPSERFDIRRDQPIR